MKMKSMSKYFISALGCLSLLMSLNAQEVETEASDSIVVKEKYGLGQFTQDVIESFKAIRPYFDYMSSVLTTNLNGESIL